MSINYIDYNPYREYETSFIQDQIEELTCFVEDTRNDPDANRIAQTHKFLAEVALFERIL